MKILLFGGSGQLGFELQKRALDLNFEVVSPVISEIDISDREQVLFLARQVKPDLVINAAAYTLVDKAEEEKEAAFLINRDGAGNVAQAAKDCNARLIQISTDYVFDGKGSSPVTESAPVNPLNVYGHSKLEGEREVQRIYPERSIIVRTSSLHGQKGVNFVHTMLDLFASRPVVKVVNDQFMSPTWAGWLAEVTLDLGRMDWNGVVHACCAGAISWYDFAEEILKLTEHRFAGKMPRLETTSASEFGRPAQRPQYSVLDCSLLTKIIGRKPIAWQEGLQGHLSDIGALKKSEAHDAR